MRNYITTITILLFVAGITSCTSDKKNNQKDPLSISDNSQTSLDWNGTYQGIVPCADCDGIKTQVTLNKDESFTVKTQYLGKDKTVFENSGKFTWDKNGSKITFTDGDQKQIYLVGENQIFHLDQDGNRIEGTLQNNYILKKLSSSIINKNWKLVELYGQPINADEIKSKIPTLTLTQAKNRASGNSGCNQFSGTYELLEGNRIEFSQLASTKMACGNMELEDLFLEMINKIDNYNLTEHELILNKAKMAPLAKFEAVFFE